ncbi:GDSL-type esterase/lipase family protein [Microbulbifer sp.]|uniref:GDSL-type esterase/lipase family protein n=1 Tax=Microbulbifer sp. TaxID=1908541 RepID=UPI00258F7850|nr:GDSL-type esterase/lipase family protein [Microbulbifer sp.]
MKNTLGTACAGLLLTLCSTALAAADNRITQVISADAPDLQYVGRVDFSDRQAPSLTWPGSSVRANFTGTALSIILDDELGQNFFNVIIDGNTAHPFVLQTQQGQHTYEVSRALPPGEHSLEVYKRTEGEYGATAFKGLRLSEQGELTVPPARPQRRMEIFGDSISCGMGNEGADNGRDDLASEQNHYWTYGAVAARTLDAELHTICRSGIGIMVSWFPYIMRDYFDQLSGVGNNETQWDFSQWTPDVVVINLLQNDSWLIDREHKLQPAPTEQQRIDAYVKFARRIRREYPDATIIAALGSMDATATEKWPDYIRKAVAQMQAQYDDDKLHTVFFDYTGYGQHPRIAQHVKNGEQLASVIREKMGW